MLWNISGMKWMKKHTKGLDGAMAWDTTYTILKTPTGLIENPYNKLLVWYTVRLNWHCTAIRNKITTRTRKLYQFIQSTASTYRTQAEISLFAIKKRRHSKQLNLLIDTYQSLSAYNALDLNQRLQSSR